MARYIDADKLWNDRPQIPEGKSQDYGAGFSECMWGFSRNIRKQIDTESADVVPKSEVEALKEMLDATIAGQETLQKALANAKAEVAREFIEAVDEMMELVCAMTGLELTFFGKYAELKKKYTK